MKLQKIAVTSIFIILLLGAFCAGYYRGAHDYSYLDTILRGRISAFDVAYCSKKNEDQTKCYKTFQDINIAGALFMYLHRNNTLPISKIIFKDLTDLQQGATEYMLEHVSKYGINYGCEWAEKTDANEYAECMADVNAINTLAKEHSNKSLKVAP